MYKEELIKVTTIDLENIALWKVFDDEKTNGDNIFLTHGTFSDRKICMGIANYFASQGYVCWIMEWRNHGESSKVKQKFNFETVALFDIKAVFNYLFEELKINKIDCITHSGGGICLTMYLIKNTTFISKINSISMFGCQAFGACKNNISILKVFLGKYISLIFNHIPAKRVGFAPHNESYYTMKQWFNWNLKRNFKGLDNFDYLPKMKSIRIPILSISGEGDRFIAPKEGVLAYLNAFENPKNKFLNCSITNGFREDYNHRRIILSKNAGEEIWKIVQEWISSSVCNTQNGIHE
jgi:predicted alpha/beta hydrolase